MQLVLCSMVLSALIAVPLGVLAATRRGRISDLLVLACALVGQAVPVFLLAILLIWLFAVDLQWLPVSGPGSVDHFILPVATLTAFNVAVLVRLSRSALLEVLTEDFVRTAHSKGLPGGAVLRAHVLRNAALPVVSVLGVQLAAQLSGVLVVETIFSWPGFGKLMYDAVIQRDIPLVTVGAMVAAALVTFVNLSLDVAYAAIDPRIRFN
jgi:ABC-type dipeptide/oligopeptide/nickel transport system permease component